MLKVGAVEGHFQEKKAWQHSTAGLEGKECSECPETKLHGMRKGGAFCIAHGRGGPFEPWLDPNRQRTAKLCPVKVGKRAIFSKVWWAPIVSDGNV